MAAPTIDDTGFNEVGLNGWIAHWTTEFQTIYGDAVDLDAESPDGQLLARLAKDYTDIEQVLKTIYDGRSPSGAVGTALSRLVQLNGISRKAAQFSIAGVTLGGTPATLIPAGSLISASSDSTLPPFATTTDLTIGGGGTISGQAQCTEAGPVNVAAGDLDTPATVITGWTTVTNAAAATPGRLMETDPVLRTRRRASVALPSQSMVDGLYAALANLAGVDDVVVYENPTGSTDFRGDPAHSIHVIIDGGLAADVANAIWVKASMGVTKVGAESLVVTDTQGNPQEMRWDNPVDVDVYITVTLNRTPNTFEVDSIKAAAVAFGIETSRIGQGVPWGDLFSPINALEITGGPGLPSITALYLGDAATPTLQMDLPVDYNARPRYDAARVLVIGP